MEYLSDALQPFIWRHGNERVEDIRCGIAVKRTSSPRSHTDLHQSRGRWLDQPGRCRARLLAPSPTRGWTGTRCPFLVPGTRCRAAEVGSLEAGVGDIHRRHPPVLAPGPVEAAVVDLDVEEPEDLELRSAEVQGLQPAPFELDEPSQLLDEPPVQLVAPHPPRQGCAPARRSTRPWCSPRPRSSSRPPDRRRAMTSAANRSPSPPSHRSIVRSTSRRR